MNGAAKYMQIGPDAGASLLQSTITGANLSEQKALLILDCNVKYGGSLLGWISARAAMPITTFFFGVCDDQVELTWLEATLKDHLSQLYDSGELRPPAGVKIADPLVSVKASCPDAPRS